MIDFTDHEFGVELNKVCGHVLTNDEIKVIGLACSYSNCKPQDLFAPKISNLNGKSRLIACSLFKYVFNYKIHEISKVLNVSFSYASKMANILHKYMKEKIVDSKKVNEIIDQALLCKENNSSFCTPSDQVKKPSFTRRIRVTNIMNNDCFDCESISKASRELGIYRFAIYKNLRGEIGSYNGYKFEYV